MSAFYQSPKVAAAEEKEKRSGCDANFREKSNSHALRSDTNSTAKGAVGATKKLETKPSMDINESAEAFIKKFKQQLLIQRLESIENYEQMLARGAGHI